MSICEAVQGIHQQLCSQLHVRSFLLDLVDVMSGEGRLFFPIDPLACEGVVHGEQRVIVHGQPDLSPIRGTSTEGRLCISNRFVS